MKRLTLGLSILLVVFLLVQPLSAQSRGVSGGGDAGRGAPVGATSTSSISSSSGSSGSYSSYSSGGSYGPAPLGDRGFGSTPMGGYTPSLQGTSFYTPDLYYSWNSYYSYLNRYYSINPIYFSRFYKNVEPLVTPAMLKMTLRQPLFVSTEMLKAIDQLEMMYRDSLSGRAVDKADLLAQSQAIRKMARQIRQNRTLAIVDIRKETELSKDADDTVLSLESIAKLRELALDLNQQLTNMYSTSSSSTISVQSYKEPSFGSVAKGIEKICKGFEHSSKKL